MNGLKGILVVVGLVAGVLSLATGIWQVPLQLGFVLTALIVLLLYWRLWPANPLVFSLCLAVLSTAGAWSSLHTLSLESLGVQYWSSVILAWSVAWLFVEQLSDQHTLNRWLGTALRIVIPLVFGVWLLVLWEIFTRGMNVPQVLLPSPSLIADRFASSIPILWADFKQTFLKAVLIGYAMGCGAGFFVAILIDRSPFLQRGLLPVGNLVSALPIVALRPSW